MLILSKRDYTVTSAIVIAVLGLLPLPSIGACVNLSPVAKFTYSPSYPKVCDSVTFNASESTDPDGFIFYYTWNFGDGNTTTLRVPIITHHFSTQGNYNVNLTLKDNLGLTDSTTKTIIVSAFGPPIAVFTWTPMKPEAGEPVLFNASNSTPNGGEIVSYVWNFGDGVTHVESEPHVIHVFQAFGNYTVVLNVTDNEGESSVTVNSIWVMESPVADFFFEPIEPRVYTTVTFNASISIPRGGCITSYEWTFGDGTPVEFGMVVIHRFPNMGGYNVSLNVIDSECKESMKTIRLKILPHIADLNEDGVVNILDLTTFAISFGSFPDHERWNAKADLDGDGKVNILDGTVIARSYNMRIDPFDP